MAKPKRSEIKTRKAERPKAAGKNKQKVTVIPEGTKRLKKDKPKKRTSSKTFQPKPKRSPINQAFIPKMGTPKGLSPMAEFMKDVKPKDALDKLREFQDMCEHDYSIHLGETVFDGARQRIVKCSLCNIHTYRKVG